MALLYYENLTDHRPDVLMGRTFDGLKNFFKFLNTTKRYLESEKAVKRLSWESANRKKADKSQNGVWIQLIEPHGIDENFETNFKLFLDESNKEVYEASASTRESNGNVSFPKDNKITILERDPEKEQLRLDRIPSESLLALRPNTYQIMRQIQAIHTLQDTPSKSHRPLLRLFEASDHAQWPSIRTWSEGKLEYNNLVDNWFVLTDDQRSGTDEQRKFVEIALNTPDFAFLEGPPGSGKTTAICELVIQLASRGKRVLLCASTHVAVDNVLERLMNEDNVHRDRILPIRIGDRSNVSSKAKPWQLEEFIRTERIRLMSCLRDTSELSKAQKELSELLHGGNETIQKMVLESANLVCGTTIGILQHPDIHNDIRNRGKPSPQFDLMIIDEASKTTFQEFLVPALFAKCWVLVGDPKQLSPYVDDESTAVNIESCLPEKYKREACIDVFQASRRQTRQRISSLICSDDQNTTEYYEKQSSHIGILTGTKNTNRDLLPFSSLIIGGTDFLQKNKDDLPLDIGKIRVLEAVPPSVKRQVDAYCRLRKNNGDKLELGTWEREISWRLARLYEQRLNDESVDVRTESKKHSTSEKLNKQIEQLFPYDDQDNKPTVQEQVDRIRRIALPSVLESLQEGFERNKKQRRGTALSDGLPSHVLKLRFIGLTWQHRMHPDIAEFSRQHIYHERALSTPNFLKEQRNWSYRPDSKRCVWRDVKGKRNKLNANKKEANQMIDELKAFDEWAKSNPNIDRGTGRKKPWEVALLTFYRGQEKELRNALRRWTGDRSGFRHFFRRNKNSLYLDIQVCTVDRFQGHEADLVLLSFSSHFATSFLESPNRLNVAITRARFQLVVFGNRNGMKKASGALGQFASYVTWDKSL